MPPADLYVSQPSSQFMRQLYYGRAKCKKTTLAALAAKAGFNVTLLEGDPEGASVLSNSVFDSDTLSRINIVDVSSTRSSNVFHQFAVGMFTGAGKFIYNERTKGVTPSTMGFQEQDPYWQIDLTKLNSNDVLVTDSYTAYVDTLLRTYADNEGISLAAAEKQDWDGWGWLGRAATWYITNWSQLPCHTILICHAQEYEKRKGNDIIWTRTQPKSTSGPHAQTLAPYFSDVLYFKHVGSDIKIDVSTSSSRDGGSRAIPPSEYQWKDLQFDASAKYYNIFPQPEMPCEAFQFKVFTKEPKSKSSSGIIKQPPQTKPLSVNPFKK